MRHPIPMAALAAGLLVGFHSLTPGAAALDFNGRDNNGRDFRGRDAGLRPSEAAVARWLEQNRHRPTALRAFVQRLPKGGDLHSHLSGPCTWSITWSGRPGMATAWIRLCRPW